MHRPQAVKPKTTMLNPNYGVSNGVGGYGGGIANNNWTQGTYENSIRAQILNITTQSVARDLLVSARPPPETRCPKAIHGHRYPCPTSDFSFFVIFYVSRAAAPEGTGGDGVLTSIF